MRSFVIFHAGFSILLGAVLISGCIRRDQEATGLSRFDGTMTEREARHWIRTYYAPSLDMSHDAEGPWLQIGPQLTSGVNLAPNDETVEGSSPFPPPADAGRPLAGLRIVLDPGHVGGKYAEAEERQFQFGDGPVIREGDLVLEVAKRLRARLKSRGVEVMLTREANAPVAEERPEDFEEPMEFFRGAEIRARAGKVNAFAPDIVIALHINATAWPDPEHPALVDESHAHIILHGCYLPSELEHKPQQMRMLEKLLSRNHEKELALAKPIASAMAEATGLPPFTYTGNNAVAVPDEPYLWARNLAANRLYEAPVIFLEPWVANSQHDYPLVADAARYLESGGEKGSDQLFEIYAGFVETGLLEYFRNDLPSSRSNK